MKESLRPDLEPVLALPDHPDYISREGFEVRLLASGPNAGLFHQTLAASRFTRAILHRTVDTIWYVVSGRGEIWRAQGGVERIDAVSMGDSLRLPMLASFQVRAITKLELLALSAPPWPGPDEDAVSTDAAPWQAE